MTRAFRPSSPRRSSSGATRREQMLEAGRPELAEKESEEASILQVYLPPALSESEVHAIVREAIDAGATEMGAVMGRIMPRIRGRFDGKEANRIVREELA